MSDSSAPPVRNWKRIGLITAGALSLCAFAFWLWLPANGLPAAGKFLRWKFDDVQHVTPAEAAALLADDTATVIWDIRRPDEFAVSQLPDARHVPPDTADAALKQLLPDANQTILVYCAVGYRSAQMARRLQALGHTNALNLEGAIFAWAEADLPLEGGDTVHPYNAMGRRMLQDDLEAE
ncbi:MAG TPA: rhodanese-like domain-containing protein [Verrucomicrobiales bacterium]|nr:rhodanese-like domain-containing protein [Verrucomicrobiales bacterium]|tara:strand:+ start:642 stop:1181 length:540 start_codon:yes stop_codon:yes gene_type:complete